MNPAEFKLKVNALLAQAQYAERHNAPGRAGEIYREAYALTRDPIIRRWAIVAEAAAAVAA